MANETKITKLEITPLFLKKARGKVNWVMGKPKMSNYPENKDFHLCWNNCVNARCDKCKKVHDRKKQLISEYNFITDGYQTFDRDGEVDDFVVLNCKNYVKEKRV